MAEANTLNVGERKRLHMGAFADAEPHGYVIFPTYSAVTSDATVVVVGDGGAYRLAAIAVGTAEADRTATVTVTRAADGATFSFDVTVLGTGAPEALPPFTAHLGETF